MVEDVYVLNKYDPTLKQYIVYKAFPTIESAIFYVKNKNGRLANLAHYPNKNTYTLHRVEFLGDHDETLCG